jgi:hypothetical protein
VELFDRARGEPLARRTAETAEATGASAADWARIGDSAIGPGSATGELEELRWEIGWHGHAPALGYLPRSWLYDRRWPRSNGAALAPDATFTGRLDVAGERIELAGWRGMVGHNWGSDHADRWIWVHVTGLGERDEEGWLDIVLARTRVGPALTKWLPAGAIQLDGVRRRIGLGSGARGLSVAVTSERLEIALPSLAGGGLRLRAELPAQGTVSWDYVTPSGETRDVRNCSIAVGELELGGEPAIEIDGRLAVEMGA